MIECVPNSKIGRLASWVEHLAKHGCPMASEIALDLGALAALALSLIPAWIILSH